MLVIVKSQNTFLMFVKMEKISEEERNNRIFILTSLIRENEKDHVRLEKELQELLDLDPLK